jgi:hypothetical protein
MLNQLLVGGLVSIANITIHALMMTLVVYAARAAATRVKSRTAWTLTGIMIATASVLMAAHTAEVAVWALAYRVVDAVPAGIGLMYFAFVNYTTLGYGDVLAVKEWQLLGPVTAMNGVLLFGWSTAVIFDVLRRAMSG